MGAGGSQGGILRSRTTRKTRNHATYLRGDGGSIGDDEGKPTFLDRLYDKIRDEFFDKEDVINAGKGIPRNKSLGSMTALIGKKQSKRVSFEG